VLEIILMEVFSEILVSNTVYQHRLLRSWRLLFLINENFQTKRILFLLLLLSLFSWLPSSYTFFPTSVGGFIHANIRKFECLRIGSMSPRSVKHNEPPEEENRNRKVNRRKFFCFSLNSSFSCLSLTFEQTRKRL
jgi:hypothetical protein